MTEAIRNQIGVYLPPKVRAGIYAVLAAINALFVLEQIWDVIPAITEGKILASLSAVGALLAVSQTDISKPAE